MLKSPRSYTSLSFKFERQKLLTINSMKLVWFGGLQKTSVAIGFDFGKTMSKIVFSISLQFRGLVLKHKSFLIQQATPPPFLFLSHRRISYPGRLTSISGTVRSSFDSVIPIIALALLAMRFNSSIFGSKLFILNEENANHPFFVKQFPNINVQGWRYLDWSRIQIYIS